MKRAILFTTIFSILFFLSCKKANEVSSTSASSRYNPCKCNDLQCWSNQIGDYLGKVTCMLNTGLVTPGKIVSLSVADMNKIGSACGKIEIGPHTINILQDTECSEKEIKLLSDTYADEEKLNKKRENLQKKVTDLQTKTSSSTKSYSCSDEPVNCNLSTMYLYGQRKNQTKAWGFSLVEHCKDSCLSSSRPTFCSKTLTNYFSSIKLTLPSTCDQACQYYKPCPEAITTCLDQCCGEDKQCIIEAQQ